MTSKEKCALKKDEYDLVAPDGGWGYLICVSAVIFFVMSTGFVPSFGLVYKDMIDEIGLSSTEISLVNGFSTMTYAVAGFLTNPCLSFLSKRKLAFIAVTMYNVGNIMSVFTRSAALFYIVFLIQGAGFGIILNVILALINEYFEEKRLFANSIIQTAQCSIMMLLPRFITIMHDTYGNRGTLLIITAVSLQGFVGAALMQPAKWHMKKVPKVRGTEEVQVLLTPEDNIPTIKLNNLEPVEHLVEESSSDKKKHSSLDLIKEMFDVPVILQLLKTNVSWGLTLTSFADLTFTMWIPQGLYVRGWSESLVAWAITLYTFGDLSARIFFTITSKWIKMASQEIFQIGLLISVLARVGFLCSSNNVAGMVFIAIMGFGRCFLILFFPLILAEAVSTDKFPAAMGFIMMMMGICTLGLGLVAGAIRDYTDSYVITYWVLIGLTAMCMVSWTLELLYKRSKSKQKVERI